MSLTPITKIDSRICNLAEIIPEYAEPERIGLNMERLGRVAAWGGFYRDQITITGFEGERSTYSVSVTDYDGWGQAVAGATAIQTAELGRGAPGGSDPDWRLRQSLRLRVNTTELFDRVQQDGRVRGPENWSRHINGALAAGLREAAWQNLGSKPLPRMETRPIAGMAATVVALDTMLLGAAGAEALPVVAAITGLALPLANIGRVMEVCIGERTVKETCFSLIPAVHFDRLAMVGGLSRMLRFARTI